MKKISFCVWCSLIVTAPVFAADLEFRARQIKPLPQPFQPVAMEVSVVNRTRKNQKAAYPEGQVRQLVTHWRPSRAGAEWIRTETILLPGRSTHSDGLDQRNSEWPLNLLPDTGVRLNVNLAGLKNGKRAFEVDPITAEAGSGAVRLRYAPTGLPEGPFLAVEAAFRTEACAPADQELVEQLKSDTELRSCLFSSHCDPTSKAVPSLEKIVRDRPNSSYAPFAKYAIARWRGRTLHGAQRSFGPVDCEGALDILGQIDVKAFVLGPEVLVYQEYLLRLPTRETGKVVAQRARRSQEAAAELDRLFPESFDRLCDLAKRSRSLEEWKTETRKPFEIRDF